MEFYFNANNVTQFTYQLQNTAPQVVQKYSVIAFGWAFPPDFYYVYTSVYSSCDASSVPFHHHHHHHHHHHPAIASQARSLTDTICTSSDNERKLFMSRAFLVFFFVLFRFLVSSIYFFIECVWLLFSIILFSSTFFYPVSLVIICHLNPFDVALKFFSYVVFKFMSH